MFDYLPFGVITVPGLSSSTPPAMVNGAPTFQATTTCPDMRAWVIGAFIAGVLLAYATRRELR
jgi:hypothetical protein